MRIVSKKEFIARRGFFIDEMIRGKIFIYPTDTIYGIGCNAQNPSSVKKIREIKKRDSKPFSIIAPSKDWILINCKVDLYKLKFLKKLPGPYTLILPIKNIYAFSKQDVVADLDAVGIRIPDNWFSNIISKSRTPFVTTSVNISGEPHLVRIKDLKKEIASQVDYIIDCGKLDGKPSTLFDLSKGDGVEIIKR